MLSRCIGQSQRVCQVVQARVVRFGPANFPNSMPETNLHPAPIPHLLQQRNLNVLVNHLYKSNRFPSVAFKPGVHAAFWPSCLDLDSTGATCSLCRYAARVSLCDSGLGGWWGTRLQFRGAGLGKWRGGSRVRGRHTAPSWLTGGSHKLRGGPAHARATPTAGLIDGDGGRGRLRRYHMSCDRRYDVELFAADEDHAVLWNSEEGCCSESPDGSEDSEPSSGRDTPVWSSLQSQTSDARAM
jgi:hypothetical protein